MGDYVPHYIPGEDFSLTLTGTVVGGNLVTATGVVAGAGASTWLGVASCDGVSGDTILVRCGRVQDLVCAGTIAKGASVKCAAAGQITTLTGGTDPSDQQVGIALAAGTVGVAIPVKMIR